MKKAVVLLSGGLDSATTLAIAKSDGYVCHALSFTYGQRLNSDTFEELRRFVEENPGAWPEAGQAMKEFIEGL